MYLAKIEASFTQNPKLFWNYHKAKLHHRSALNPVISHNNQIAKTSREKADSELFNSYFCSVFRRVKTTSIPEPSAPLLTPAAQLFDIVISEVDVAHHLSHLDPTKATGPDGIPGRILQECISVIAPSLCLLFNHSLNSGAAPSEWKSTDVSPLHKKDNKEPATNYRPISLLPIISKVLERCVCNRFYEHVRDMISTAQHDFPKGRSCVTRLLARRASRRPGTPLERKIDAFGRPNSGGISKLFSIISLSILIYLKRNSFNSHYYYIFDILINLIVYLAE